MYMPGPSNEMIFHVAFIPVIRPLPPFATSPRHQARSTQALWHPLEHLQTDAVQKADCCNYLRQLPLRALSAKASYGDRRRHITTSCGALLSLLVLTATMASHAINNHSTFSCTDVSPPLHIFILGGFLIPVSQYTPYKDALTSRTLNTTVTILSDPNTLENKYPDASSLDLILADVRREMCALSCSSNSEDHLALKPSVALVGHSRGGKLAVETARALIEQDHVHVSSVTLLDPVDAGGPSCLPLLSSNRWDIPTCVVSLPYTGFSRYYKTTYENKCAPRGADAVAFYQSLPDHVPSALITIPSAGHLQVLGDRRSLPFAETCGVGPARDKDVVRLVTGTVSVWSDRWREHHRAPRAQRGGSVDVENGFDEGNADASSDGCCDVRSKGGGDVAGTLKKWIAESGPPEGVTVDIKGCASTNQRD